ncbi:Fic family protein [Loktanella ponticola]|uniref:Fic family protein n=1 Tax=Yoonia ponticola TaxID=1524255 RepID=A0A7W9EZA3_9RHOB|nr:Fic family protein [Yoonia ponticola]MBB5723519.1 Fic family protein [Yoonia ponticola]|tara:strand:+ start:7863 stop:9149 length:1287 start_codon:yes stop_codon:yes gene_type:complete
MALTDQDILNFTAANPGAGRDAIRKGVARDVSETTVWRALKRLVDEGRLEVSGKGRATGYQIAGASVVRAYLSTPYNRRPPVTYRPEFLDAYVPGKTWYLPEADRVRLLEAGRPQGGEIPAGTYARRILEQLLVDLSWASSRMEGNTYDILQTERLIRFGEEVEGKDRKEALMILNHKEAIQYVVDNLDEVGLRRPDLFSLHALLSDGLLADPAMSGRLRAMPVGISHSSYRPLDDAVTIAEEFDILLHKAAQITDPFEQSFFLLVHIPYLQAFADVNKRTSRVASNIPLLKSDLAPMSFTAMDDSDYIDGLIGIYELNNVSLLREVYMDAYLASAEKYRILRADVESPEKAALAYREFVRTAVRRCVLEFKEFRQNEVLAMAAAAAVPEEDRDGVVAYIRDQLSGLHEGNVIRYRLKPSDLVDVNLG